MHTFKSMYMSQKHINQMVQICIWMMTVHTSKITSKMSTSRLACWGSQLLLYISRPSACLSSIWPRPVLDVDTDRQACQELDRLIDSNRVPSVMPVLVSTP